MSCPDPLERSYRLALALSTVCDSMLMRSQLPGYCEYVAWTLARELTDVLDEARAALVRRTARSATVDLEDATR